MTGVTAIICCYNSGEKLIPTLKHLARQKNAAGIPYELILVDNNCEDNSIEIATKLWESLYSPFPLKVVTENKPGLNFARQLGIQSSSYEFNIFCDDDNWLCEDYFLKSFQLFGQLPNVALIGGVGEAEFEKKAPDWFFELAGFGYAIGAEGRTTGYVDSIYGAGMCVRKSIFLELINEQNGFKLSDRKGKILVSGGDMEICIIAKKKGYLIYLDCALTFKHFLTSNRLKWHYYLQLRKSFGNATAYINHYYFPKNDHLLNSSRLLRECLSILKFQIKYLNYLLFPNQNKSEACANFYQQRSMRLSALSVKKKLFFTNLRSNLRKA